jgi:hypothetical protein
MLDAKATGPGGNRLNRPWPVQPWLLAGGAACLIAPLAGWLCGWSTEAIALGILFGVSLGHVLHHLRPRPEWQAEQHALYLVLRHVDALRKSLEQAGEPSAGPKSRSVESVAGEPGDSSHHR